MSDQYGIPGASPRPERTPSAHTPGPWHLDPDGDDGDGGQAVDVRLPTGGLRCVAQVWGAKNYRIIDAEGLANARLIAAAPDLYEALDPTSLEAVADALSAPKWATQAKMLREIAKRQRAALSKAEA